MIDAIRDHDPNTALLIFKQGLSTDVELRSRETASNANLAPGATLLHWAVINKALKIITVKPSTVAVAGRSYPKTQRRSTNACGAV